ncbi:hypothetical protein T484DRAFT_1649970, partial [Baffinella frigidus]
LLTYLPTYLPTYIPSRLTTYLPTRLPTYLPTYLPTHPPTHQASTNLNSVVMTRVVASGLAWMQDWSCVSSILPTPPWADAVLTGPVLPHDVQA